MYKLNTGELTPDFINAFRQTHLNKEDAIAVQEAALEYAAEMMAAEYATDPELTAFCALDGEDFEEQVL